VATLQLEIRDSKFVSHNGVNVQTFSDKCVEANGWKCQITESGKVICIAKYSYKDVKKRVKFCVQSGYAKLKLKVGDTQERPIRSYKLNHNSIDGVIRLSNNFMHPRCAYFREASFQRFLNEHGITSVRYESANGIFRILQENDGENIIFKEEIESDGTVELIYNDVKQRKDGDLFIIERDVQVSNATWVVKTVKKLGEVKHRILYTTENSGKVIRLPKFE